MLTHGLRSQDISPKSSSNFGLNHTNLSRGNSREASAKEQIPKNARQANKKSSYDDFALHESALDQVRSGKRFDNEGSLGYQGYEMKPSHSYDEDGFVSYEKFKETCGANK